MATPNETRPKVRLTLPNTSYMSRDQKMDETIHAKNSVKTRGYGAMWGQNQFAAVFVRSAKPKSARGVYALRLLLGGCSSVLEGSSSPLSQSRKKNPTRITIKMKVFSLVAKERLRTAAAAYRYRALRPVENFHMHTISSKVQTAM